RLALSRVALMKMAILRNVMMRKAINLSQKPSRAFRMPKIDKSLLKFGIPRRIRDDKHRLFINSLPCARCWSYPPNECAHISAGNGKGMALKVSDEYTLPLCHNCHAEAHRVGEKTFFGDVTKASAIAKAIYEVSGDKAKAMELLREVSRA